MTATFRLAHLTDVHLAPLPVFPLRWWNVKRVLGYLNWQRGRRYVHVRDVADRIAADARAQSCDHIAVTGDLCNIGLPEEYANALAWLAALGPPDRVAVIPGNHDIYSTLHGDPGVARWRSFMSADAAKPSTAPEFPFVRRVGPVALIALNSAVETPPFVASGRLGATQLAHLAALLPQLASEGAIRVVLIHHPPLPGQAPPRRALEDAASLAGVLARHGAELVLYGHNHRNELTFAHSRELPIPVVGAATASAGRRHHGEPLASYNIYEIAGDGRAPSIELVRRGLAEPDGPVVELERRVLAPETV